MTRDRAQAGRRRDRAAGDRLGADGDDLRRGPHLGGPLQPGRDAGRLRSGAGARRPTSLVYMIAQVARRRWPRRSWCSYLKGEPDGHGRCDPDVVPALHRRVPVHVRPGLRRPERRHGEGDGGQLELRPGDRLHGLAGAYRRRGGLGRGVQPGRRGRDRGDGARPDRRRSGSTSSPTSPAAPSPAFVFKFLNPDDR